MSTNTSKTAVEEAEIRNSIVSKNCGKNISRSHHNLLLFQRIVREARVWSKMKHQNIVPLLGMWLDYPVIGCPCPVSPWISNYDLDSFLAMNKNLPEVLRLKIVSVDGSSVLHDGIEK